MRILNYFYKKFKILSKLTFFILKNDNFILNITLIFIIYPKIYRYFQNLLDILQNLLDITKFIGYLNKILKNEIKINFVV